jgi:imidazolonepropionase-like amidohydrolase
LSAYLLLDWREQASEANDDPEASMRGVWRSALRNLREMREAGVRIMTGSDAGVIAIFPGATVYRELELFVDSVGMTPLEALASATRRPAEFLGIADSVGTIERGKVADLVLLDADPLAAIGNSRRISAVVLGGTLYDRTALAVLLAAVDTMPDRFVNDWLRREQGLPTPRLVHHGRPEHQL